MSTQLQLFDHPQGREPATCNFAGISGLIFIPFVVNADEETELIRAIDELSWRNDLSRRVQHYGYKYDYKARRINESMRVDPLPQFASEVGDKLVAMKLFSERPDQLIINEYKPGQGIALHVDCEPCFKGTVATLSLGSVYLMDFEHVSSGERKEIWLDRGSVLVLSGEARYEWKHGIKARKSDHGRQRGRRISMTFRNVILSEPVSTTPNASESEPGVACKSVLPTLFSSQPNS